MIFQDGLWTTAAYGCSNMFFQDDLNVGIAFDVFGMFIQDELTGFWTNWRCNGCTTSTLMARSGGQFYIQSKGSTMVASMQVVRARSREAFSLDKRCISR